MAQRHWVMFLNTQQWPQDTQQLIQPWSWVTQPWPRAPSNGSGHPAMAMGHAAMVLGYPVMELGHPAPPAPRQQVCLEHWLPHSHCGRRRSLGGGDGRRWAEGKRG